MNELWRGIMSNASGLECEIIIVYINGLDCALIPRDDVWGHVENS